jgi:hypothetical protein
MVVPVAFGDYDVALEDIRVFQHAFDSPRQIPRQAA